MSKKCLLVPDSDITQYELNRGVRYTTGDEQNSQLGFACTAMDSNVENTIRQKLKMRSYNIVQMSSF